MPDPDTFQPPIDPSVRREMSRSPDASSRKTVVRPVAEKKAVWHGNEKERNQKLDKSDYVQEPHVHGPWRIATGNVPKAEDE